MKRALIAATALAGGVAVPLAAQSYRTTVETRQVTGPLAVDLTFAVGALLVRPATHDGSYRLSMTYAEDLFEPRVRFDAERGRLAVELEGDKVRLHGNDFDASDQQLDLALPRDVPLDLDLSFGAIEAEIELGDLTLGRASIRTGASETTVSFAAPGRGSCERLSFQVGAAEFEALGLGNSGCRTVSLEGAVGDMHLDFSGERRTGDTRLLIKVGLGTVRISVPDDVGVRMTASRFLASVHQSGLVKQGSYLVSPGFDAAEAKLFIEVEAALGRVDINRLR